MNVQEREQYEYEMGMATERQNVFAMSCLTRTPDDSARIEGEIEAGRFVLVDEVAEYCRHTDAIIGRKRWMRSSHETREEAVKALREVDIQDYDVDVIILPKKNDTVKMPRVVDDSVIPF